MYSVIRNLDHCWSAGITHLHKFFDSAEVRVKVVRDIHTDRVCRVHWLSMAAVLKLNVKPFILYTPFAITL
jgi:hypothetical protein